MTRTLGAVVGAIATGSRRQASYPWTLGQMRGNMVMIHRAYGGDTVSSAGSFGKDSVSNLARRLARLWKPGGLRLEGHEVCEVPSISGTQGS